MSNIMTYPSGAKRILVRGPALSQSGYGEQCRFALRSLRKYPNKFDIYLENIPWGRTGWIWEENEERQWLDSLLVKTIEWNKLCKQNQETRLYDMSLQVTIPNEWEKIADVNVGYTAGIETDRIAVEWIEKSNLMDRIIVVSNHAKHGFDNSAYNVIDQNEPDKLLGHIKNSTPITAVNYPVKKVSNEKIDIDFNTDFNFLVVAQWGTRKNVESTIRWFVEEFYDMPVGLVLKASMATSCTMDYEVCVQNLKTILSHPSLPQERKCKIHLIHGNMSQEQMASLYKHPKIKAFMTLAHGEGFGLPIFEAAYSGLPVIAPGWSGQCDFLYAQEVTKSATSKGTRGARQRRKTKNVALFKEVGFTMGPVQPEAVWQGVINQDAMWCFAEQGSAKMAMRDVYKNYSKYKTLANKLKKHVTKTFTEDKQYKAFADATWGGDVDQKDENFDVENWLGEMDLQIEEHE